MDKIHELNMTVGQIIAMRSILKLEGMSRITSLLQDTLEKVSQKGDNVSWRGIYEKAMNVPERGIGFDVTALLDGVMRNVDTMWEVDADFTCAMGSPHTTPEWGNRDRVVKVIMPDESFVLCAALVWGGAYRVAVEAIRAGAMPMDAAAPIFGILASLKDLRAMFPLPEKLKGRIDPDDKPEEKIKEEPDEAAQEGKPPKEWLN